MSTPSAPQPQDSPQWPTPAQAHPAWQDAPAPQPSPTLHPLPGQPAPTTRGTEITATGAATDPVQLPAPQTHTWTILSSAKRTRWWRVPETLGTSALLGDVRLDLREAELSGPVTTIEVHGLMSEVKIIVPDTCRVECTGSPILGDFESKDVDAAPDPGPAAPLIRVTGSMLLGSVTVYRTGAPVGEGAYGIDGLKGARRRREERALRRRGRSDR